MAARTRILFIDAYDSFSNNVISLLEIELAVQVTKIHIDTDIANLDDFLRPFAAIVCGPGPGHPANANDVGLFRTVWRLADKNSIPVLGICLGFQSLALEFGGQVTRLSRPRHGIETEVTTSGTDLFTGVSCVRTVQYHSLHATLEHDAPFNAIGNGVWKSSASCPELVPLAWDFGHTQDDDFKDNPGAILMAIKHATKPFYGVQFHPESICSQEGMKEIIRKWWDIARSWLKVNRPNRIEMQQPFTGSLTSKKRLNRPDRDRDASSTGSSTGCSSSPVSTAPSTIWSEASSIASVTIPCGNLTAPAICEALNLTDSEAIILDSEMRQMPVLGDSSIIGIVEPDTMKIQHSVGSNHIIIHNGAKVRRVDLERYKGDVFPYIKEVMTDRSVPSSSNSAFSGGLMGYITYEACLETIGIGSQGIASRPEICFAFIERSVVIDHTRQLAYIQSLRDSDNSDTSSWLQKTAATLKDLSHTSPPLHTPLPPPFTPESINCHSPTQLSYTSKIRAAQEHIRAGNSYELCLTDQTSIAISTPTTSQLTPWQRFTRLRRLNRAPFAAYLRLGPLTLLSTSPERFMCWSRPVLSTSPTGAAPETVSAVQFRPIKGTVKKHQAMPSGSTRIVTKEEATALLLTQKERAENLMIVDLIRHDLYGVAGPGNVSVPALMVVEEYETVFQLVSVVEGQLRTPLLPSLHWQEPARVSASYPAYDDDEWDYVGGIEEEGAKRKTGIDVLAASLPPGSMTGAPKRRSCQLLQSLEEQKPRSIYSGIIGYMCVTGKGDFSVVIRSAYRWDDEVRESEDNGNGNGEETWHIGAGGAITELSTEQGEWEEMLAKLQGTLRAFAPGADAAVG